MGRLGSICRLNRSIRFYRLFSESTLEVLMTKDHVNQNEFLNRF